MYNTNSFDWSILDRTLIIDIVGYLGAELIGKSVPVVDFTPNIRSLFRSLDFPINIRTCYGKKTETDSVWVGGLYDSSKDQTNNISIYLLLQFNPLQRQIKINKLNFKRMCSTIADTILHEIIHMRQYRRRNYVDIIGYHSTAQSGRQRAEQVYLGHDDEIDAYAFNIACQLVDRFLDDHEETVKYLNSNQMDKRKKTTSFKMYLEAFDHDHGHKVIRKLKKKIINYMPNARDFGKPYKTTDWLRK